MAIDSKLEERYPASEGHVAPTEPTTAFFPVEKKLSAVSIAVKQSITTIAKLAGSALIVLTEVALVVGVGAYVGEYVSNKTIADDCRKVNLAKVGDVYLKCTIVELPKDSLDHPPR